jgi:ATP-dependent Clp protease adaptor protein ClpS
VIVGTDGPAWELQKPGAKRGLAGKCLDLQRFEAIRRSGTGASASLLCSIDPDLSWVPQSCHAVTCKVAMTRERTEMDAIAGMPGVPRLGDDDNNNNNPKRRGPGAPGTAVITKTKPQTKRPSLYRVLLLNDDYTPMEFVVHVLERFFNKDQEAAHRIMMHVHQHGIGECGVYTYEVAETKVTQVMDFARKHQHPLQCVMEKK